VFSPCSLLSSRQSFSCDLLNFHKFVEHLYNIDLSACAQLLLGIIDSFRIDLSYNIAVLLACFVNRLRDFTLGRASKTLCFAQKTRVAFCRRFETVVILRVRACLSSLQPRSRSGVRENDTIGIHSRWPAWHHP